MAGTRNDEARNAIAAYVDRLTIWPSKKYGEMTLNSGANVLGKRHLLEEETRRECGTQPRDVGDERAAAVCLAEFIEDTADHATVGVADNFHVAQIDSILREYHFGVLKWLQWFLRGSRERLGCVQTAVPACGLKLP